MFDRAMESELIPMAAKLSAGGAPFGRSCAAYACLDASMRLPAKFALRITHSIP